MQMIKKVRDGWRCSDRLPREIGRFLNVLGSGLSPVFTDGGGLNFLGEGGIHVRWTGRSFVIAKEVETPTWSLQECSEENGCR